MVAASVTASRVGREAPAAAAREARLRLLIASGGDDRVWPDAITRRNRYGATVCPAPNELWLSSSTACAVSERGWAAAGAALEALTEHRGCGVASWFDDIRGRLAALFGAPGAEVVLSASGTEAELVALHLALTLAKGPLVNIVVAPAETGSGVPAAAAGRHFLDRASLGGAVARGERLAGLAGADVALEAIEIRQDCGAPRRPADVDAEAAARVDAAVARGAFALLHVLDASKTARAGVSRDAAAAIASAHRDRAMVVVDACQLRCPPEQIRADLAAGLAVMVTGSKFAGGPAFCGALLLPPALAARLTAGPPAPSPLGPYSAALDWPAGLRRRFGPSLTHPANLGLGLRWTAALAEIDAYLAVPAAERGALLEAFGSAVQARIAADPQLSPLDGDTPPVGLAPVVHADGSDPRPVYEALRAPRGGERRRHLGQPVVVGPRTALRVCASMGMIVQAAAHGFAGIEADLDEIFVSWRKLRA
jgi:hypothetical protein